MLDYDPQQLIFSGQHELTITLNQSSQVLNQLMIVGYGEQSRAITSSVAKLDDKVLKNVSRVNVGSVLQGTLSGLNVVNHSGLGNR